MEDARYLKINRTLFCMSSSDWRQNIHSRLPAFLRRHYGSLQCTNQKGYSYLLHIMKKLARRKTWPKYIAWKRCFNKNVFFLKKKSIYSRKDPEGSKLSEPPFIYVMPKVPPGASEGSELEISGTEACIALPNIHVVPHSHLYLQLQGTSCPLLSSGGAQTHAGKTRKNKMSLSNKKSLDPTQDSILFPPRPHHSMSPGVLHVRRNL